MMFHSTYNCGMLLENEATTILLLLIEQASFCEFGLSRKKFDEFVEIVVFNG